MAHPLDPGLGLEPKHELHEVVRSQRLTGWALLLRRLLLLLFLRLLLLLFLRLLPRD